LCLSWLKEYPETIHKDYAYYYLGEASYSSKNYPLAINYYKKALESLKEESLRDELYQSLGWCFLEQDDFQSAESYFSKIASEELKVYCLGSFYYKKKEYDKAYNFFDKFLRNYPQSPFLIRAYIAGADSLYNLGRVNDAVSLYRKILEGKERLDNKILEQVYYNLGWCYLKLSDYKKSIEIFQRLVSSSSSQIVKISAQINIADVYQQEGRFKKAIESYQEILKNFPDNLYSDYIQFQVGVCLLKEGDFEAGIITLENLTKNFPDSQFSSEARYYLALAQNKLKNFDLSIRILEKLLEEKLPKRILEEVYLLLVENYIDKKDYFKAVEVLKGIPKKLSQDSEFLERVKIQEAFLLANQDKYFLAKKKLESFLKKHPSSKFRDRVLFYLGNLYHKEENYPKAEFYYQNLIKDYPQSRYLALNSLNLS